LLIKNKHFGVQRFKTTKKKKTKTNYLTFYLVLPGVFNFWGSRLAIMQAFIHSCILFLDFLGHVIHFCKFAWVDLMETYFKLLEIIYSTDAN
jgi:hypothetical protein